MKKVLITAGGLLIASVLALLTGMVFLTSPSLYQYQPQLQMAALKPGSEKQERTENWCRNRYGAYGLEIHDAAKLHNELPLAAIYGDSFVEAEMIPGLARMQNFIGTGWRSVGIGFSGAGAGEYAYLLRHYPAILPGLRVNIVFIGDVHGDLDEWSAGCGALPQQSSNRLDAISAKYRLYAWRRLIRRGKQERKVWKQKFHLHENENQETAETGTGAVFKIVSAWKEASGNIPLVICYAPEVPRIAGKRIDFTDPQQDLAAELDAACQQQGVGLINLGSEFRRYYRETGKFVRGFFNTPPAAGHLNEAGHAIAGRAISRYLQENFR